MAGGALATASFGVAAFFLGRFAWRRYKNRREVRLADERRRNVDLAYSVALKRLALDEARSELLKQRSLAKKAQEEKSVDDIAYEPLIASQSSPDLGQNSLVDPANQTVVTAVVHANSANDDPDEIVVLEEEREDQVTEEGDAKTVGKAQVQEDLGRGRRAKKSNSRYPSDEFEM